MVLSATILRIIFGISFMINGLNFYFHLIPINAAPNAETGQFIAALVSSGIIEIVKLTEVAVGVALLANVWVPLAAVFAMPLSVGIAYTNIVLEGGWFIGGVLGFGTLSINVALLLLYFNYWRPLLTMRCVPRVTGSLIGNPVT